MEKVKKYMKKIYYALVGATIWDMCKGTQWMKNLQKILVDIQTLEGQTTARLMWRVIVTIIILKILDWSLGRIKVKFSTAMLCIIIVAILWLGFATVVLSSALTLMAGGNPEARITFIKGVIGLGYR